MFTSSPPSLIVPRPIASVTTQSLDGSVNAAPFSFFNMCGEDNVMLSIEDRLDGQGRKDTDRSNTLFELNRPTLAEWEAASRKDFSPSTDDETRQLG
jgi:hypothetical protein